MNLSRRGFLGTLAAATAGLLAGHDLDPERLLWVPGRKTFFIPDPTIAVAATLDEAVEKAIQVVFPDGTRYDVLSTTLKYYGGYEGFVRDITRQGGRIVSSRGWVTHPAIGAA